MNLMVVINASILWSLYIENKALVIISILILLFIISMFFRSSKKKKRKKSKTKLLARLPM